VRGVGAELPLGIEGGFQTVEEVPLATGRNSFRLFSRFPGRVDLRLFAAEKAK